MSDNANAGLAGAALYVGVAVIIAWMVTIFCLALHVDDQEVQWSRLVFLLSSVEAVAFGAAGALFGTQIQRQRVSDAKERATKAESEAKESKDAATKGKALAAAVKAEAKSTGSKGLTRMSSEGVEGEMSVSLALANEILP